MRKLMLVFLMLFLPLQWTVALAADCCLRHDAQTQEHHAAQAAHHDHAAHDHAKADLHDSTQAADGKQVQADCNMNCAGCHAHHYAAAVFEPAAFAASAPAGTDDTPYFSGCSSALTDNLYRPPLARLA